ncbi:cytochrome bd ubiquinol oxidase subunit [Sparassis latifolia]
MYSPLGLSLAPFIRRHRSLYRWIKPFATWYADLSGYRKVGYKYDDLLVEERDDALGRLTPREAYDRAYRLKRGSQSSVLHENLPKSEWLKPEEDVRYLKPHVVEVEKEDKERSAWDHMAVGKK